MIDVLADDPIPLQEARELLPRGRGGAKFSLATLTRWCEAGYRGVILDSVRVGSVRCTTREALARFVEAVTEAQGRPPAVSTHPGDHPCHMPS